MGGGGLRYRMNVGVVPFRVSYLLGCSASKGPTTGDFVVPFKVLNRKTSMSVNVLV